MEQGWDPDVKRYFRKILNTISVGLFWLMSAAAAGLYFGLATPGEHLRVSNIIFYVVLLLTFGLLIRYFVRLWKN
jgi:FtsH-binding integral membrane protein